ncbi:MAG: sulfite exporter TauE/SafE family protein [Rhodoglobus sp.]|nr:sulfite exporter TauE/SafE family protein [Rhodoglobus sp.]
MTRHILSLVGIGLLGGFLSGLFGIGGGILMVPLLVLLLRIDQRRASALSLAGVLPAAIVGSITYATIGSIDLVAAGFIAIGGVVGAIIGTRLLRAVPLGWLRWLFVVLLVLVAVRMFIDLPIGEHVPLSVWSVLGLVALGLIVGVASGLFGIGGGVLIVPALVSLFGFDPIVAKGTSLLVMIPTSISGTIANWRAKLVRPIDGLVLGGAAALASFPGALIAHVLPTRLSNILFAILILIAAVQLAIRAWRLRGGAR